MFSKETSMHHLPIVKNYTILSSSETDLQLPHHMATSLIADLSRRKDYPLHHELKAAQLASFPFKPPPK